MQDRTSSIESFLTEVAAKKPTPGGGSVAAVAGALAAAMGEMVVNYSVDKKDLAAFRGELQEALAELYRARMVMLELMVEDQAAFDAMSAARKLPETDATRQDQFDAALLACIRIPQSIAATAVGILHVAEKIVEKSNKYLLSDLAVCCDLATATARAGASNVRVNLGEVKDAEERKRIWAATQLLERHAVEIVSRVSPKIWKRIEG